jgi:hypothetical protein
MPLTTLLWLALLVVLALLFALTLRRMSALIARTRDLERFQRAVESLDRRFAGTVQPLVQSLDETRRHAGDPATLQEQLTDAQAVLANLQVESRALGAPPRVVGVVAALAGDIDRAVRAASLVEHGLGAMANKSIGRDLEAQTSLKRGALNLRHAQEAFGIRARDVAELRPADLASGAAGRRAAAAPLSVYPAGDPDDLEGRFDPRM